MAASSRAAAVSPGPSLTEAGPSTLGGDGSLLARAATATAGSLRLRFRLGGCLRLELHVIERGAQILDRDAGVQRGLGQLRVFDADGDEVDGLAIVLGGQQLRHHVLRREVLRRDVPLVCQQVATLRSPLDPRRGMVSGRSATISAFAGNSCLSSSSVAFASDTSPLPTNATVQRSGAGLADLVAILLLFRAGYALSNPSVGQPGLAHANAVALPVDPDRLHDTRSPWYMRRWLDNGRQHHEATRDA